MKKKNVWISETLYDELILAKENLEKNKRFKSERVTLLEASDRMGKWLNMMRTSKSLWGDNK
jgi:hypothetical protein